MCLLCNSRGAPVEVHDKIHTAAAAAAAAAAEAAPAAAPAAGPWIRIFRYEPYFFIMESKFFFTLRACR